MMKTTAGLVIFAATLSLGSVAGAATITNGNFEASTTTLTGWTVAPGTEIRVGSGTVYSACCNTGAVNPQSNQFAAFGGGNVANTSSLSQSFATVAGLGYTVSYKLTALGGGAQSLLAGVRNGSATTGAAIASLLSTGNAGHPFQSYSFSFNALSALSTLAFSVSPAGSGTNDGVDVILDDVQVSAAPEPGTWGLMIIGFGLAGVSIRRRSAKIAPFSV